MTSSMRTQDAGERLEPFEFVIDAATNDRYLEAEEGFHLRYIAGARGAPPIVHPGLLLNQSNTTRSPSYHVGPDEAGLHARDEATFLNPAYLSKRLRVTWTPIESYEKRGRFYTVTDTLMVDEDDREILRRKLVSVKTTGRQPVKRRTEQSHAATAVAAVEHHDPSAPIGVVLSGRPKHVTLERMRLFSGWPRKNIHTDEEVARAAGVPAPIASATQNMGHLCELLIDNFGEEWLVSGTLSVVFTRPVYAGDTLLSRAVITSQERQGAVTRYELELMSTNQHGTPVTLGRATVLF